MALAVGERAPGFTLDGIDGRNGAPITVALEDLRGQPVVIAFYPADDSPVCTAQLGEYTRRIGDFVELDAAVLAISPQSPVSHAEFAAAQGGFGFPLLSDEDKSVAASYGNLGLLDLYRRSTFVIDGEGQVVWLHRSVGPGLSYSGVEDLVAVLEQLG
ncbi:MAG: peroxiredoxin [Microthrixaceae bacterium]